MGSKWIWIIASVIYGIVSSGLYTWICHRKGRGHTLPRLLISFAAYTAFGLAIVFILWKLMQV